jgi:hypothetical protein
MSAKLEEAPETPEETAPNDGPTENSERRAS